MEVGQRARRHRACQQARAQILVETKGVEPSSLGCEPSALPLSYVPILEAIFAQGVLLLVLCRAELPYRLAVRAGFEPATPSSLKYPRTAASECFGAIGAHGYFYAHAPLTLAGERRSRTCRLSFQKRSNRVLAAPNFVRAINDQRFFSFDVKYLRSSSPRILVAGGQSRTDRFRLMRPSSHKRLVAEPRVERAVTGL